MRIIRFATNVRPGYYDQLLPLQSYLLINVVKVASSRGYEGVPNYNYNDYPSSSYGQKLSGFGVVVFPELANV
jgi:hypothetical protein